MKKLLLFLWVMSISVISLAQLNGNGYYRIRNVGSTRYITVKDDKGSINISTTSADLGAVELYKNFSSVVSDPSSILYINHVGSNNYKFECQGTDTYKIIGYYLKLSQNKDGSYKAYQENSVTRMYLADVEKSARVKGAMGTNDKGTNYRDWEIIPVSSDGDNYFCVTPEFQIGQDYYSTLYASFPFTCSEGMTAYYIKTIDGNIAVYAELANKMVPAATPVIIKSQSNDPASNKLTIGANSVSKISGNKLGGVYFCNTSRSHNNVTPYDASTMRVLGLTSDGKLGFVAYNSTNMPANKAYLKVAAGAPSELVLMSEAEYEEYKNSLYPYYDINVSASVGGTVTGGGSHQEKSEVTLTAVPDEGYHFVSWSDGTTQNPYKFVVSGAKTLSATFKPNEYKLTYTVDGAVYKTISVTYGSAVTAEAAPVKEGYTFSGWSNLPSTMPAKDVTVSGSFSVNEYKLTYIVDGAVYKTISVAYGSAVTAEAAPVKEGYTFSGWSNLPSTMPAKDVTVSGSFSANKYKLTYTVDGAVYKTVSVAYGSTVTAEAAPVKEGYTFSGWSNLPGAMPAKDVTVAGSFSVNEYKLTYTVDGAVYKTVSVAYGSAVTAEAAPVREGYTFSGWSEIPSTMPAKDVTVAGSFSINSYNLTYMIDGAVYKTVVMVYGSSVVSEVVPEKEGYTFSGWSNVPETMPAKDVVVSGQYVPNKYKVTYMVDGEVYKTVYVAYGTDFVVEPIPSKEGYNFNGWSNVPETMPAEDIVLEGSFSINMDSKYNLIYMVDGKEFKRYSYKYGESVTIEEAPVKEGYTFSGWSEIPEQMPMKDVVVTGVFVANEYQVIYKVDGQVYATEKVSFGQTISLIDNPVKEGHTFSGWGDVPATMPANDVTLAGIFTVNEYQLTYVVDGAVYKTVAVLYGKEIAVEAAPMKEGCTFSGWSSVPATMPAGDVTVTGSFVPNKYLITYKIGDQVYATESVSYGEVIVLIDAPVKDGYIFSGWSECPATMPAHDIVISGSFASGVSSVEMNRLVDVYTLQGLKVKEQVLWDEVRSSLPHGIYLVEGKKMLIK